MYACVEKQTNKKKKKQEKKTGLLKSVIRGENNQLKCNTTPNTCYSADRNFIKLEYKNMNAKK